jgi:hypothetical protein
MRLHDSICAVALAAALATTAAAQTAGSPTPAPAAGAPRTGPTGATPSFEALDKNHDGYISRLEAAEASLPRSFTELDKNNDGRLDRAEFAAQSEKPASESRGARAMGPNPNR